MRHEFTRGASIMDMKTSQYNNIVIITLSGRFDAYGAPQVEKGIKQALEQGNANVLIDLARVHFIDSTGLATLVQGMKRCSEQHGDLLLSSLQDPVQVIVELTHL